MIRLPPAGEAGDLALWGASGSWVHGSAEAGLAWTGQPAVAATAERMDPMPPIPAPRPPGFSRRTLLAASAAGLALIATGCSSLPPTSARR